MNKQNIKFKNIIFLEPGDLEFSQSIYVVKESVGTLEAEVERKNGADGQVTVQYKTSDINARANKDYIRNWIYLVL